MAKLTYAAIASLDCRVMRRPTVPVFTVVAVEDRQVDRLHRVEHKPRQMVLRQPLAQARRQQQLLLAITRQEVLADQTTPDVDDLTISS